MRYEGVAMQYNDEQKHMIQEIVDYIAKLPVGTVITTMGVMEKIFPDKKDDIWESRMYMGVDLFDVHFVVLDFIFTGKAGDRTGSK